MHLSPAVDSFRDTPSLPGSIMAHRILIVDDNQQNCELLEAYLAGLDCQVEMAEDGRRALDKVKAFQPDLILLDVMMPKLSGFEVCKTLKDDPQTRKIMILMVTALNELGDIERAVEAGTNDFLSKPVNKTELLKHVRKHAPAQRHLGRERAPCGSTFSRWKTTAKPVAHPAKRLATAAELWAAPRCGRSPDRAILRRTPIAQRQFPLTYTCGSSPALPNAAEFNASTTELRPQSLRI